MRRLPASSARSARLAAGLALLALCIPAAASAATDARQWIAHADQHIASLIYGTPRSDDVLLSITCDRATKALTIWFQIEPSYSKDPETMPMELFSEAGRVNLTGQGSRSEMDDSYALEATSLLTPEFEKLLTESETLSIMVEDGTEDFPLDDIARSGAADLVKTCGK